MLKPAGLLLALSAVGLGLYLGRDRLQSVANPEAAVNGPAQILPDYTMTTLHTRRFDETGRIVRDLKATRLDHYPDARGSLMDQPFLTVRAESGSPWLIRAKRGNSPPGEQEIFLKDDVRIDRAASARNVELALTTPAMRVVPDDDFAETAEAVSIRTPGGQTMGVGMKAYLAQEQLNLLANVRGQYEPKSRSRPRP